MSSKNLNVAMVVRNFSPAGGLELYAHKVIEGLLHRHIPVTVFCQDLETDLVHDLLNVERIRPRARRLKKWQRLQHDFDAGNAALVKAAERFDIVHSQHYPTARANVVTFHNHGVLRWSQVGLGWEKWINNTKHRLVKAYQLRDEQDRIMCANAQCLVFPSNVMQQDYYNEYQFLRSQAKPYVVAYPGSSLKNAATTTNTDTGLNTVNTVNTGNEPFTFLFVGRGYRRKGLDILLSACSKLAKERTNFRLLIAGLSAKPLDAARLALYGIADKVEYLGFRSDMHNVYAQAQSAILPSRVEPFGMGPLQAMEFGLVPIVSRVSGVSEVLQHGIDSLILENHLDDSELASLMAKLLDDKDLTQRLRATAKHTAGKINWDQTVDQTLKAYELVITQRSAQVGATVK